MSEIHYGELGDTFYLHFASNDTSGSGDDGASAVVRIRQCGDAASAAAIHSPTASLLSHANYNDGAWEVQVDATSGNGYSDAKTYAAFATLAVDSQNPTGYIGKIILGKLQTAADNGLLLETDIATYASPTSFTLTAGSDQDDAYNNRIMVIEDATDVTRRDVVWASDYTGGTKTVTLDSGTATFTAAVGDKVRVFYPFHPLSNADTRLTQILNRLPAALSSNGNMKANVEEFNGVPMTGDGSSSKFSV